MFLPLGDNLEKQHLPLATICLIFVNLFAHAWLLSQGLTGDAMTPADSGQNQQIVESFQTWGLVPAELAQGHLLGLLTNMFVHATIFHLLGNMLVLWAFGPSLENSLGSVMFAVCYMLWGALASVTQVAVNLHSETAILGASGAIAGVMGAYLVLFGYAAQIRIFALLVFYPVHFNVPAIAFGVFWILSQLWNASWDATGDLSGVAWMAHIGGFAAGVLTLLVFKNQTDRVLVADEWGTMRFIPRDELANTAGPPPEAGPEPPSATGNQYPTQPTHPAAAAFEEAAVQPNHCPRCQSEIQPVQRIADRLARCPNPACHNLVYLESDTDVPSVMA